MGDAGGDVAGESEEGSLVGSLIREVRVADFRSILTFDSQSILRKSKVPKIVQKFRIVIFGKRLWSRFTLSESRILLLRVLMCCEFELFIYLFIIILSPHRPAVCDMERNSNAPQPTL